MENIIQKMIGQHNVLRAEVKEVSDLASGGVVNSGKINEGLKKFREDLVNHLELENNTFYLELLKKMKAKDWDTEDTEKFIAGMKDIEKVVIAFLDKYKDSKSISDNIEKFKDEFVDTGQTLSIRLESEEKGVYTYWDTL